MTIQVRFAGVCTHVRYDAKECDWLPVERRVMLANSGTPWRRPDIPIHYPMVTIAKVDVLDKDPLNRPWFVRSEDATNYFWDLHGAKLRITGAGGTYDDQTVGPIPPLKRMRGFQVRQDLVRGTAPNIRDWFSAFFDFDYGTVTACCNGPAYGVRVELVPWPHEPPRLQIEPIEGGDVEEILLSENATIDVSNESPVSGSPAIGSPEDKSHFGLHYMIGGMIPEYRDLPTLVNCSLRVACDGPRSSLGVYCSSSNWP